jgi:hypothetical protein
MSAKTRQAAPWIALGVAAAAWAANMQAGQILPYPECDTGFPWTAITSWLAALIAIGAAALGWRAGQPAGIASEKPGVTRAAPIAGLLFAFALVLQGVAALVISACER